MKNIFIILFLSLPFSGTAQDKLDALWAIWNNSHVADTIRINAMQEICTDWYLFSQPDSAFYFAQLQYNFALEKGEKLAMAEALNTQGISYNIRGDFAKSLDYYKSSLKISEEIGDQKGIARSLGNIGIVYSQQGDYAKTLECLNLSLKIQEELGDSLWISNSLTNIGNIYRNQGDYSNALECFNRSLTISKQIENEKSVSTVLNHIGIVYKEQGNHAEAIDYFTSSLKIKEKIGDSLGVAGSLTSIGNVYSAQGNYEKALEYHNRTLKIAEKIGDKNGISITLTNIVDILRKLKRYAEALDLCHRSIQIVREIENKQAEAFALNHIGNIYKDQGDYKRAEDYFNESLKIFKEIENKPGIAMSNINMGHNNFLQGNYDPARKNGEKALDIAQIINNAETLESSYEILWKVNKKLGRHEKALEMYELYISTRDSIQSEANQRAVIQQEYKYAYEKRAVADSIQTAEANKVKDAQLLAEKAKTKQEQQQKYFLYAGLALVLVFGGIILNRFRATAKQKLKNLWLEKQTSIDKLESASRNIREKLDLIKKLRDELKSKSLVSEKEAMERISTLLSEKNYLDEPLWNEIIHHYDNVHNNYSKNITQKFDNITKEDIKLLILVKMGFLNKEISAIRGKTIDSTKKAKQRLRIKLGTPDLDKI